MLHHSAAAGRTALALGARREIGRAIYAGRLALFTSPGTAAPLITPMCRSNDVQPRTWIDVAQEKPQPRYGELYLVGEFGEGKAG